MRAGGFDDTLTGFGTTEHPFSATGFNVIGVARFIDVEYRFREHLGLAVVYSHAPTGATMGYHEPLQFLMVNAYVDTIGVTGAVVYRNVRAAIGPAWHVARTAQSEVGQLTRRQSHGRLGLVGQLGIQAPSRSTIFFDTRAQYNRVGRPTVGPFVSRAFFDEPVRTLPAASVRFDHWVFTVGMGFRF
jgi:hypothetical protein